MVGPDCIIGDGCVLAAHSVLERHVRLAPNVKVGIGSILGGDPQDLKFKGEVTTVEVGANTTIREYATINRGTSQSFKTTVGENCFIMSYVHLAHDCHVGNGVIISNATQLAGHVTIEEKAIISGVTAVHQFVKIGKYSFIGGCSRVPKDVAPFVKAVGNPIQLFGLNSVGLERNGFPEEVRRELKRAYRLFFKSELNLSQARERAAAELHPYPEVQEFLRFFDASDRGLVI
jgi:UDP-N-acetylglucosamine acyltransferase